MDAKQFETARAMAASRGIVLLRTESSDGPVRYFAERPGHPTREIRTFEELREVI